MIQILFFTLSKAQFETLGRLIAVGLGSLVSPTWPLVQQSIQPFIDINLLLSQNLGPATFMQLVAQMQAQSSQALAYQLIPSLLLCMMVSICFILLCSFVGKYIARQLADHLIKSATA